MLKKIKSYLNNYFDKKDIKIKNNQILVNLAKLQFQNFEKYKNKNFNDYEYKAFSQFGEDGLINLILKNIYFKNKTFVEFGVENYEESNTKLLLEGFNWSGTIFDCDQNYISNIKKKDFYWKFNLNTFNKFINSENINSILNEHCEVDKISLLSIDIDGNDYWVWKAMNCADPEIVVIEYNSIFGCEKSVTIPYRPDFDRKKYHWSYWR